MHPAIKDFLDNKEKYFRAHVANTAMHMIESNLWPCNQADDPLYQMLKKYNIPRRKLWEPILDAAIANEFTLEELNKVIDEMPSSWYRAQLIMIKDEMTGKSEIPLDEVKFKE